MEHLKIICIGGGTGLHTTLTGLRGRFPNAQLGAVVSMMDSGGSTGRLRDEFGYLPPGDMRRALIALSDAPLELRALMQHRFKAEGSGLHDHVVGNIILTALKDLSGGDEYAAIEAMSRILNLRGMAYPVTLTNCHLVAKLEDGSVIRGETNIDIPKHNPNLRITALGLEPRAVIFEKTAAAIESADIIIIGPGDLYTSLMPNLIVEGMVSALKQAKRNGARIILVTNTMTKHGETNKFRASDFLSIIQDALDGAFIDAVIMNTARPPSGLLAAYAAEGAEPVLPDLAHSGDGPIIIGADVISTEAFARHNSTLLAKAIEEVIMALGDWRGMNSSITDTESITMEK